MLVIVILLAIVCMLLAFAVIMDGGRIAELEYRVTNLELDIQKEEAFRDRSRVPWERGL